MKKYVLSMLALVLCSVSVFAQEGVFTFNAQRMGNVFSYYNDAKKEFNQTVTVAVEYNCDKNSKLPYNHVPEIAEPSKPLIIDLAIHEAPAAVTETVGYKIYATANGADPKVQPEVENVRFEVWNDKKGPRTTRFVGLSKTGVIKAAVMECKQTYTYEVVPAEDVKPYVMADPLARAFMILNGLSYDDLASTYKLYRKTVSKAEGAYTETCIDEAWQSYIKDFVPAPTLKTANVKNSYLNDDLKVFWPNMAFTGATENLAGYLPAGDEDKFDSELHYFVAGEDKGKHEADEAVSYVFDVTTTFGAHQELYALHSENVNTNEPVCVDSRFEGTTYTKLIVPVTDADMIVFDKWSVNNVDRTMTFGLCVENITVGEDVYSILSDGISSFVVKNSINNVMNAPAIEAGKTYYVAGKFVHASEDLLGNSGFVCTEENKPFIYDWHSDEPIKIAPAVLTEANLAAYSASCDKQPLINVAMKVDFDLDTKAIVCGSTEICPVYAEGAIAEDAYTGEATVCGIIFGTVDGKVAMYVEKVAQDCPIELVNAKIVLDKVHGVDATNDLKGKIYVNAKSIDANIDADELEAYVLYSIYTKEGVYVGSGDDFGALGEPFAVKIRESVMVPGEEYEVRLDMVYVMDYEDLEGVSASASFETAAPALIQPNGISVFDNVFSVALRNVEGIAVKNAAGIHLLNAQNQEVNCMVEADVENDALIFSLPYISTLDFGNYTIVVDAEAIVVDDDQVNVKELSTTIAAGTDADKARIKLGDEALDAFFTLDEAPMGVNVFQYLPEVCEEFFAAIAEAQSAYRYVGMDEEFYQAAREALAEAVADFQPTMPEVDKTYTFRTNYEVEKDGEYVPVLGDYLNIKDGNPTISAEPSYIQFHPVYDEFGELAWYLYDTANESYLENAYGELTAYTVFATSWNKWIVRGLGHNLPSDQPAVDQQGVRTMGEWYIEEASAPVKEEAQPETNEGEANATVITSAQAANMNATFYTVGGAKLNAAAKGINIAKFANGEVKKVLVK